MTPERWQQIRGVLEEAIELAPGERSAFLNRACSSDSLRKEVETLLASSNDVRSNFLQSFPPLVTLAPGTKLGEYEVKSLLGSGGMGEVYRARDTRLEREVAIKVLPRLLSADPDRLRRFGQEARAAAALSHPNILAVFQMGTYEGAPYLVSELLEGETLREQIKRGCPAVRKAIDYGIQIARGLAVAHDKGIVHRDLKPENLFVTKDGRLKILDFGLAKLTLPNGDSPTLAAGTEAGVVMGTVGYMSPEQVRGEATDHRADIFAFGAILYELLAGMRAFQKPTSPETMTAILHDDPPALSQIKANIPPALQRVVHRCLEKSPDQRFQSASDLAFALDALSDSGGSTHLSPPARESQSRTAVKETPGSKIGLTAETGLRHWLSGRWVTAVIAAVLVTMGIVAFVSHGRRAHAVTERDVILINEFVNTTGDNVFDGTLKKALSVALGQSPYFNIFPESQVRQTLKFMGRSPDERITNNVGREICLRNAIKVMLTGSIANLGSQYLITVSAINPSSEASLAETQGRADSKEKVLSTLDKAAGELRGKLGESLSSVQRFDTPLAQATTASMEALKAFTLGDHEHDLDEDASAIPFYLRAVELDANFALAYARLGTVYGNTGQPELSAKYQKLAFDLRDRVSERERLYITAHYYSDGGQFKKGLDTWELYKQTYPRDAAATTNLSILYTGIGQPEKGLENGLEAVRREPDSTTGYSLSADAYLAMGRLDEAKAIIQTARPNAHENHEYLAWIAILQHDSATQQKEDTLTRSDSLGELDLLLRDAELAASGGQFRRAEELLVRVKHLAQRLDMKEVAATAIADQAIAEAASQIPTSARGHAAEAITLLATRDVIQRVAFALALAGDNKKAQALATELGGRYPQNDVVQYVWVPVVKAVGELNGGNATGAIQTLNAAGPFDGVQTAVLFTRSYAYVRAGRGHDAETEFQKLWNLRFSFNDSPYYSFILHPLCSLSQLGLARAYNLQGDTAKARIAYQDFLNLWKDADPNIPVLQQAKAEYAKLR